jgi:hypothetical protein
MVPPPTTKAWQSRGWAGNKEEKEVFCNDMRPV